MFPSEFHSEVNRKETSHVLSSSQDNIIVEFLWHNTRWLEGRTDVLYIIAGTGFEPRCSVLQSLLLSKQASFYELINSQF